MNDATSKNWILKPCAYLVGLMAWQLSAQASPMVDAFRTGDYQSASKWLQQQPATTPEEQYASAEMYLYGYAVPRDTNKAIEAYTLAADKNYLPALQFMSRYELVINKRPEEALKWFKKAADLKDVPSLVYCAGAHLYGYGTPKNEDIAKRYYIEAAKLGDPRAQLTLAEHFFDSKHGSNTQLAWIWLNKACEKNYLPALLLKAQMLQQGNKIAASPEQAAELMKQLLAKNYLPALVVQAQWAVSQKQWDVALKALKEATDKGYTEAYMPLAELYSNQESGLTNQQLAFQMMQKAAENYKKEAFKPLSDMYRNGVGVQVNPQLADAFEARSKLIQKIPEDVIAQRMASWISAGQYQTLNQGVYHLKGILSDWANHDTLLTGRLNSSPKFVVQTLQDIFKPNYQLVQPNQIALTEYLDALMHVKGPVKLSNGTQMHYSVADDKSMSDDDFAKLNQQASLGVADSQFLLGVCYLKGINVKADNELARGWFAKAMDQEDLRAQYELALLDIVSADEGTQKQGLQYLKDAAYKGNANAEYALGILYEAGLSNKAGKHIMAEDIEQAKNMYRLAAVNELPLAKYRLAEWLSREPLADVALNERVARQNVIRDLYREAVQSGIEEARMPLAFHEATSTDPKRREWAFSTAQFFAGKGDKEAALLVGLMIDNQLGDPNHTQDAMQWYKIAKSHPIGGFVWATLHTDSEKAKELMQQAADAGFSYANLNLAVLAQQKHQDSRVNLQKAVDSGNIMASHLLANQLMLTNVDDDKKQSLKIFERLASKGDADAQMKVGYMKVYGLGGGVDLSLGQQWLIQAAQQKHALAQFLLGYMNHMGQLSGQVDDQQAKYWFKKAAFKIPNAWIDLGFIYETVDKDYVNAQQSYSHAATNNKMAAFYNEGLIYKYGKGMPVDFSKAQYNYDMAAKAGSAQAMLEIAAICLRSGDPNQDEQAYAWYQKAASLGQPEAYYRLGLMSEAGIGTDASYTQAVSYYQMAKKMGDARGAQALKRIELYKMAREEKITKGDFVEFSKYAAEQLQKPKTDGMEASSVEFQYLTALDAWNHGQVDAAQQALNNIVKEFPHFVPAKELYMQLLHQDETNKKSV